jgi:carbon-monoxide dehydrogenase small subunit
MIDLSVNRAQLAVRAEPRTTLLDALRDAGLTGVHAGCEQGACGACTVLMDGQVVLSCLVLAVQAVGHDITTIEGLGTPDALHPVMESYRRNHGLQCGFCTPAMVLASVQLLDENPTPTEADVREALSGNVCRCTGYAAIVASVLDVVE